MRREANQLKANLVATASEITAVATLALSLAGCGIGRVAYLSPEVVFPEASYVFQEIDGRESKAPVAVKFAVSGIRIAVWAPQSGFSADRPFPVCVRTREVVLLPPIPWIFTTEVGTASFDIAVSIAGEGVTFDPSQVNLQTASGSYHRAPGHVEKTTKGVWSFKFDIQCTPHSSFDLEINGISRNGAPVAIPRIRFAPASEWRVEAI